MSGVEKGREGTAIGMAKSTYRTHTYTYTLYGSSSAFFTVQGKSCRTRLAVMLMVVPLLVERRESADLCVVSSADSGH